MDRPRRFPVVVGTDGSTVARAAVATTLMVPWPDGTEVRGVVARRTRGAAGRPGYVLDAFDRAFTETAAEARNQLAARWPAGDAVVIDNSPAEAILTRLAASERGSSSWGSEVTGASAACCSAARREP
jgi:hypothetical protein